MIALTKSKHLPAKCSILLPLIDKSIRPGSDSGVLPKLRADGYSLTASPTSNWELVNAQRQTNPPASGGIEL